QVETAGIMQDPLPKLNANNFSEVYSEKYNFSLFKNYPNPFNPATKIRFSLPEASFVTLKVYDVLGREIKELVNEVKPSGEYEVEFNGSNLPSGTYVYKLTAGKYSAVGKMTLMK
ncbi:T9SS type A sorting domain-containing protein, partial [Melioribacter sp. OK-1-Me]|uniref:T9SS type A sorting domain-containing protein n=1 Tax=Melioribacter sp. OK-1-Me TaxID=3461410 RepID=UPI0040443C50